MVAFSYALRNGRSFSSSAHQGEPEAERYEEILAAVEPFHEVVRIISESDFCPNRELDWSTPTMVEVHVAWGVWSICEINIRWADAAQYQRILRDQRELLRVFRTLARKVGMLVEHVVVVFLEVNTIRFCIRC